MTCFRSYKQISQLPNHTAPNDGWQPRLTASIVYFYPFFWIILLCNSFLEKNGGTRIKLSHCRMTAPHLTFINTPLQMTQMFMSNLFSFIQLHLGRLEIWSNICGRNPEWTELRWKKEQEKRYCCVSSSGQHNTDTVCKTQRTALDHQSSHNTLLKSCSVGQDRHNSQKSQKKGIGKMERPAAEKKPEGLKSTGFFIWILFECQMIAIFYAHLSARTCEHRIHLWKSQTPQYI